MNKISKRFFVCFLTILILPISIFSVVTLNNYKKIYRENIIQRECVFLEKTCSVLENNLENLAAIAFYHSGQEYLKGYILKRRIDNHTIREAFRAEISTHTYLSNIYYYNPVTENVVYTERGTLSLQFYAQFYGMEGEDAAREFFQREAAENQLEKVESPQYGPHLRYVIRYSTGEVWMFSLSEDYLERLLAYEDAYTILQDEDGNVLYDVMDGALPEAGGYQPTVEAAVGSFVLVRKISEKALFEEVQKWQNGFLTMILFLLLLGGGLVTVFTFYNVRPIRRMRSWYEEQIQQTAQNRKEALLLAQMLIGHENRTAQFQNTIAEAGLFKETDCFRVILVTTKREFVQEWNKIRMYLLDYLEGEIYPVELSSNRSLVLLAGLKEKEDKELEANLFSCVKEIEKNYGIQLTCYVGSRQPELDKVSVSYHETISQFYGKQIKRGQVVYCESMQTETEFRYPELEIEVLYNALIEVDLEKTDLITDLLVDIMRKQKGNRMVRMSLYYDIVNAYYAAYMKLKWDVTAVFQNEKLLGKQKEADKLATIELLRIQFREYVEGGKKTSEDKVNIIDKVIRFIDENEEYSELCVNMVADCFGISISNLSHQFKKQTGNTISNYIRNKKFAYAAKLLRETDETVQRIGCMVGYAQTDNFVKNFKQYYDMTPVEYRKQSRL